MAGRTLLVTGGAGFIGSAFVLRHVAAGDAVVTLDKLTYSGNPANLAPVMGGPRHEFVRGDIDDGGLVREILEGRKPRAVVNFAAETHVDRSIADPDGFLKTNVLGTASLLRTVAAWWRTLHGAERDDFRFLHISTDEVYGSLGESDPPFTEATPYAPNSPYSASKAASDHFVRAWNRTYGLPTLVTNCSNNYGPRQFPEKLIPLMTLAALEGKPLPLYGDGLNIRDWLHVDDHCEAIDAVLEKGVPGETYNIGGRSERRNIDILRAICAVMDREAPLPGGRPHEELITRVADRPGHDFRYSVDCGKLESLTGWRPRHTFEEGLRETVAWYLANPAWVAGVRTGEYRAWIERNYGGRRTAGGSR